LGAAPINGAPLIRFSDVWSCRTTRLRSGQGTRGRENGV